jgi:cytochrome P450
VTDNATGIGTGERQFRYDDMADNAVHNMHGDMRERRSACPVAHTTQGWYTVTRYEDVKAVLGNPGVWSNIYGVTPAYHDEGGLLGRDAPSTPPCGDSSGVSSVASPFKPSTTR